MNRRQFLFSSAVSLFTTASGIAGLEVYDRTKSPQIKTLLDGLEDKQRGESPSYVFDKKLGWVLIPNLRDVKDFMHPSINTDENARRIPKDNNPFENPTKIVNYGDSFTFGSEVHGNQTIPFYLSQFLKANVQNAGVAGYGMDQIFLSLKEDFKKEIPQLALFSIIPNDITRMGYNQFYWRPKPFFDIADNKLKVNQAQKKGALENLVSFIQKNSVSWNKRVSASNREPYKSQGKKVPVLDVGYKIIEDLAQIYSQTKTPIVFTVYPSPPSITTEEEVAQSKLLIDHAKLNGMPTLNLMDMPGAEDKSFYGRWHPKPQGYLAIAERVGKYIVENIR